MGAAPAGKGQPGSHFNRRHIVVSVDDKRVGIDAYAAWSTTRTSAERVEFQLDWHKRRDINLEPRHCNGRSDQRPEKLPCRPAGRWQLEHSGKHRRGLVYWNNHKRRLDKHQFGGHKLEPAAFGPAIIRG